MTLPTFQENYDDFAAAVESDPDHTLDSFGVGTMLDAFAGVSAAAAQGVQRFIQRTARRFFRRSAAGADLDAIMWDRYRLTREGTGNVDISDADWNAWVDAYLANGIGRGTVPAMQFWIDELVAGVDVGLVTEDEQTGIITITVTAVSTFANATVLATITASLSDWKPAGHPVNVTVTGGT